MVDFKSVLGTLLESGLAPSASQRLGNAANTQQGGGLAGMLGGAGGGLASMLGGLLDHLPAPAYRWSDERRARGSSVAAWAEPR